MHEVASTTTLDARRFEGRARGRPDVERRAATRGRRSRPGRRARGSPGQGHPERTRSSKDRCKDPIPRRATTHRPCARQKRRSARLRRRDPANPRERRPAHPRENRSRSEGSRRPGPLRRWSRRSRALRLLRRVRPSESGRTIIGETLGRADGHHAAGVYLSQPGDRETLRHLSRRGPALLDDRALITMRGARPKGDDRGTREADRTQWSRSGPPRPDASV